MTPRLAERLNRLEAAHGGGDGMQPMPPELVGAWLRAIAVGLGGYPRPKQPVYPYLSDCLGDGFARGIGFADRDEMEAVAEADPAEWGRRVDRAHQALCERYRADDYPDPRERAFRLMVAALDELAGAKSHNADWPEDDDDRHLARALAYYGVRAETLPDLDKSTRS